MKPSFVPVVIAPAPQSRGVTGHCISHDSVVCNRFNYNRIRMLQHVQKVSYNNSIFEQWAYEGGLVVTSLSIVAEPWKHLPPSCVYIMWIFSPVQSVISMDFWIVWDVWNTPWPFRHLNSSWSISMLSSTLGRFEKFLSYIIMQLYLKAFCTWHLYILEGH